MTIDVFLGDTDFNVSIFYLNFFFKFSLKENVKDCCFRTGSYSDLSNQCDGIRELSWTPQQ